MSDNPKIEELIEISKHIDMEKSARLFMITFRSMIRSISDPNLAKAKREHDGIENYEEELDSLADAVGDYIDKLIDIINLKDELILAQDEYISELTSSIKEFVKEHEE